MTVAAGACRRLLLGAALATTLASAVEAAPLPPEKPPELGGAGAPEIEISPQFSPLGPAWPQVGSWLVRPLRPSPEADPEPAREAAPTPPATPAGAIAGSVRIPLPPRRPPALGGVAPLEADSDTFAAGGSCFAQLKAAGAVFAPAEQPSGNPGCAIDNPIRLSSLAERGSPGGSVQLPDKPIISCRLAVRFGEYIRTIAPTLAASRNAPLASITTGPGWECRGRNRQRGGKLSAHANGLALDVNTFFFANRERLPVSGNGRDPAFAAIRQAACALFTTVLGPGSDGYHEDHLHLDIMRHGRDGKYRLCR